MFKSRLLLWVFILAGLLIFFWPDASMAFKEKGRQGPLDDVAFAKPELWMTSQNADIGNVRAQADPKLVADWSAFLQQQGGQWKLVLDRVTGRPSLMEGKGIPWIPGTGIGNSITAESLGLPAGMEGKDVPVEIVAQKALEFLATYPNLYGVDAADLVLNRAGSLPMLDYLYYVDFLLTHHGVLVEGAHITFRLNHGNMVQMGQEYICPAALAALNPKPALDANAAWQVMWNYVGGQVEKDEIVNKGRLTFVPVSSPAVVNRQAVAPGTGLGYRLVYTFSFHRPGVMGTWEAKVDAHTGELLSFLDANRYGSIKGNAYKTDQYMPGIPEVSVPFPFADYSPSAWADQGGLYPGTTGTSTMTGRTGSAGNVGSVDIVDTCGAISLASDAAGVIDFGQSAATDCSSPGGGAGNTRASRTQFYNVNSIKIKAYTYLSGNSWLQGRLTDNVNLNQTCNAYWNGSSVNFFHRGTGQCWNTGELPGVSLHEWAHGLDSNDGSPAGDRGTGETYGDFSGTLQTHGACAGAGFFYTWDRGCGTASLGYNCGGYGDCCVDCSGIRVADYGMRASGLPHFAEDMTSNSCTGCTTWACSLNAGYAGPCGYEGHCESYISTEPCWDLPVRQLTAAPYNMDIATAWQTMDRLWYASRSISGNSYSCPSLTTTDGCAAVNYFSTFRVADDCDGNLANGTPHAGGIFRAFSPHKISCGAAGDASNQDQTNCCPVFTPDPPVLSGSAGNNSASLNWGTVTNAASYNVYRNDAGCDAGFTRVGTVTAPGTNFTDNTVVNGVTYYYRLQGIGTSQACSTAMSNCVTLTPVPCETPGPPSSLAASPAGDNQISLSWTNGSPAGVTFNVYRAISACPGSGYTQIATGVNTASYLDTPVSGQITYAYVVTSVDTTGQCESLDSNCDDAITTGPCTEGPTFAGLQSVTNPGNATCTLDLSWNAGTANCGGPLQYKIYRSTTSGFPPGPSNLIATVSSTTYSDMTALTGGTTYYYVVRAVDTANGMEETNLVERSGTPSGPQTVWTDDAGDSGTAQMVPTSNCGGPISWTISHLQNHTPGGSQAYRSVQAADADNPSGINPDVDCSNILSPPITTATDPQITFWTQYNLEANWDGVVLETRICGEPACTTGTWQPITNAELTPDYPATLSNTDTSACSPEGLCGDEYPYPSGDGTIYINDCDYPPTMQAFTGTNATWTQYTATLPAGYDDVTMQFRFNLSTDCLTGATGAYIDDISVISGGPCTPGSGCPNNPFVDVTPDGPLTLCTGATQLLTAGLTGGTGPFTYQWTRDGSPITGANSSTYTAADSGTHTYNCLVRGSGCTDDMYDPTGVQIAWQSAPTFAGLVSVTDPANSTCTLNLAWNPATSPCPGGVTYSIYRSTTSPVPTIPANRIASGVVGTGYSDSNGLVTGTTYYYVVHAVAVSTGGEEGNAVERSGAPTGPPTIGTWVDDAGDSGTAKMAPTSNCGDTISWAVSHLQNHTPSGTHSYRSVEAANADNPSGVVPNTNCSSILSPPLSTGTGPTISFWTQYDLETNWDGAVLEARVCGDPACTSGTWQVITNTELNPDYPSTLSLTVTPSCGGACGDIYPYTAPDGNHYINDCDYPPTMQAFTGANATWNQYTATLPSSFNNATMQFRFNLTTDCNTQNTGAYVDDITVTQVMVPGTCTTGSPSAPPPVADGLTGEAMRLSKVSGDTLHVTYDVSTCSSDHAVMLYGTIGNYADYAGEVDSGCNAGASGAADFSIAATNVWFNLVWADSGNTAGHPGFATSGARTWPANGHCGVTADDASDNTCD